MVIEQQLAKEIDDVTARKVANWKQLREHLRQVNLAAEMQHKLKGDAQAICLQYRAHRGELKAAIDTTSNMFDVVEQTLLEGFAGPPLGLESLTGNPVSSSSPFVPLTGDLNRLLVFLWRPRGLFVGEPCWCCQYSFSI